jgi:hypothetical protein
MDWIRLAQYRDRWRACCECSDDPSGFCATELVSKYTDVSEVLTDAVSSFETSVYLYETTLRKIAKGSHLYTDSREKLNLILARYKLYLDS